MIYDAETETTYCAQAWSAFRFNLENNTGCPWFHALLPWCRDTVAPSALDSHGLVCEEPELQADHE